MRASNIHSHRFSAAVGVSLAVLLAGSAEAALSISDKATSNVSCSAGVCAATAKKAVLNVSDLTTMLAAGSVSVQSGSAAQDITVDTPFSWTSSNALTLDANRSLTVNKPVADTGPGALTLTTGKKGDLRFAPKGNVSFLGTSNSLTINSRVYTLVDSIASLASAIAANPSGLYALAHDYDASVDGTYSSSPVATSFAGAFEGLGNTVKNLDIDVPLATSMQNIGFFSAILGNGSIHGFGLTGMSLVVEDYHGRQIFYLGALAGENQGIIQNSFANSAITSHKGAAAGGLVGINYGVIERAHASANMTAKKAIGYWGGLAGMNFGSIQQTYAASKIAGSRSFAGDIAGYSDGPITDCYAIGSVATGGSGGLIGTNFAQVSDSFSTSSVSVKSGNLAGGLIGQDVSPSGSLSATYWDMDTSGIDDPSQGAGSPLNDPGITGLTDAQLKSGLPVGFDPKVWAQKADVNEGYPYLIDNPPVK